MTQAQKVISHYGENDLVERIGAALRSGGLEGKGPLSSEALAPLDQFHTRGLAATAELAKAAGVAANMRVLDIGSGLGGPSRYLAATYGCHVHGIDLSPTFVAAAQYLAERSDVADKVSYECANALDLPCDSETFDVAWTQHVAMNIADRDRLYAEVHRVLRKGGRLAAYDVVVGNGEPLHFPVPWSREPATSFLLTPEAMRAALEAAGFDIVDWTDGTAAARDWFAERRKAATPAPQPLGLHVAMGPEMGVMAGNLGRNVIEGRVAIVQAIAERRR
jgi:sarcosine/dimethylglycine N-methyltransferase